MEVLDSRSPAIAEMTKVTQAERREAGAVGSDEKIVEAFAVNT